MKYIQFKPQGKNKKPFFVLLVFLFFVFQAYSQKIVLTESFKEENTPAKPDYSNPKHWAALPNKKDAADSLPKNKIQLKENQAKAEADVFFIHPTIYTYQPKGKNKWNGDVTDSEINEKTDYSTILNQASVFNESCRIYAPRYRQAHIYTYFTQDKETAAKVFDIAYSDVKAAFEYYLQHYNQGRPIVIASHSQGTQHGKRLLKEYFDGKALQKQLVIAYLVGMVTPPDFFENIPVGNSASQTRCFVNWRTFKKNYYPPNHKTLGYDNCVSVNPLTWDTTQVKADRKLNLGIVGLGFKLSKTGVVDAQNHNGMLWIGKIHIPGSMFVSTKNWHRADYNLFWMNIRENVKLRISSFMKNRQNPDNSSR